ncbi:related to GRAM domain-containing protein 2 [Cephalotrichum gorgonifer]|uniref:Related to GRAM domain-containing protein 2 n=1 Tax=Cephalotrichum gorgonifer TaxID=2041049 RepID=A0AAE8N5S0_9PEZI|nr:related to GRAM domain-containing protein 2 [Cephalotrichum gorgonifer]
MTEVSNQADELAPLRGGRDSYASQDDSLHSRSSTKSTTASVPSPRSSFSRSDHHRQSSQVPDTSSVDVAYKTSTHSSERSGSVDSESRVPRSQSISLRPTRNPSRSSTSPAGRIRGIFRAKKSNSTPSLDRGSSPDRNQPDAVSNRDLNPTSQPQPDPSPRIEPTPASRDPSAAKVTSRPQRPRPKLDTAARPHTPPTSNSYGPAIVNTPPTPTDPVGTNTSPTRRLRYTISETGSPPSTAKSNSASPSASAPTPNRRLRSGSNTTGPSKLSNSILAPHTPSSDGTPSPAASNALNPSTPSSGFFSSVLSAAQNAANTISTSIQNTPLGQVNKATKTGQPAQGGTPPQRLDAPDDGVEVKALAREMPEDHILEKKEPAINTLGSGDLSLGQLGLSDPGLEPDTSTAAPVAENKSSMEGRARSESTPVVPSPSFCHPPHASTFADDYATSQSLYGSSSVGEGGEKTPPPASLYGDKSVRSSGVGRAGSTRSALGRRRNRGSSAATGYSANTERTGTTIGAAIVAANASFAQPRGNQSAPKLTGFAIASKKRNRDFHSQFKSVPDDDYLIEDYSCALQREILAHGRLYVSEGHLCFSSNILGWMTTLVLSFDEIVSVEKRSTALLFKNGLMISTLHNKHVFASFTNRDATYDLIIKIWQLGHPKLQSTLNGVRLEGPGGDKTERIDDDVATEAGADDQSLSGSEEDDSDEDIYDEDDESADLPDASQVTDLSVADGRDAEKTVPRKASGPAMANGGPTEPASKEGSANGGSMSADFPGPVSHAPTECGDAATHYDKFMGDEVLPAPMGQVFSLLFGAQSVNWICKFLTDNQKCTELQMDDKRGLSSDNMSRTYSYIKPLSGSIGPKQTRCIVTEAIDNIDFDKAVNVTVSTQTPDVPSGGVFSVKTRYCFSWAEKDQTRLQVNCGIEWTGKSWIKGPIENGARDGQLTFTRDLFTALKSTLEARAGGAAGTTRKKKGARKAKGAQLSSSVTTAITPQTTPKSDWGLLEPVRGVLEPILDIVRPILTGNVVYGLLVGLLVAAWFGFGFNGQNAGTRIYDNRLLGPYGHPDRLAAYEEMWSREESHLWEWLEERVGLHRLGGDEAPVRNVVEPRSLEERMRGERMEGREVAEAIRVTEEKLRVLKEMVGKREE